MTDIRVNNKHILIVSDEIVVDDYFESARIESPHPVNTFDTEEQKVTFIASMQGVKPPQWVSENYYLYVVGYQVYDSGKVWRAKNTTHTWIQPALTGNGAISWEFVKDWIE